MPVGKQNTGLDKVEENEITFSRRVLATPPTLPTLHPPRGWGGNIYAFSGGLSENECKYLNERDHKFYMASQTMGGQVIFFPPT